ncbi:N-acetylmuramoyl-L-alanine amidase family protein [Arcobacter sp. YIC-464]|uniref:N-acetylmuramoyl-L-alanine amidase family protein n=1 Tax=Arcobacter sp. YIC-464 TaxID=3376631 RepID=UPI003C242E1F
MSYLKAVLKKDDEQKIESLKKLIILGEKLNKDTTPDKKKLEILLEKQNPTLIIGKEISESNDSKPIQTSTKNKIESIYTLENSVVINYSNKVTNDDVLRFFELKNKDLTKDVYDLKGNYPFAKETKISIKGVDKIVVGQFKPYTLRIVIANKKNLKTSYLVDNKQIILTIDDIVIKKEKKQETKKEEKQETKKEENIEVTKAKNQYIDEKNSIRTLFTQDNKIIVEFNKNVSKNDIDYVSYKNRGNIDEVFDIKGKFAYAKPIKLDMPGIDKISIGQIKSDTLRLRLSNKKDLKLIYVVNKKQLVIKILNLPTNLPKKQAVKSSYNPFKDKVIVIDAGHGKQDVGAVGPNKRYEKVVTLKVSKQLYYILKKKGYKVYLTRHGDSFIKVRNRTNLANDKNADIFISIHANSVPKSKANKVSGIETFFLSPARSERAKRVAAKENSVDVRKMSDSTKAAFLESLNRPRITASHKLAIDVQAGLLQSVKSSYKGVKDSGVREGPFWVLVGAQMPSILVELGYMSHPVESRRLYDSKYQKLLAQGIANGIDSYFLKNP